MRVDPSSSQSPIALTQTDAAAPRPANKSAGTVGNAQADTGTFAMTDQLAHLLAAVKSTPDVRPEAIAGATAKVASGELETTQAAGDTARAFLDGTGHG
jgi:hypothetical protein